ncbi:MAG: hypothetical protein GY869_23920 [Planctomycetes bacterium]|nr:hypothetical protein [Planctomycetota bacterium]
MPINYKVNHRGHFIHAVTEGEVTADEFVDYEVAHAIDDRVHPPVDELFEIHTNALKNVTTEDITRIFNRRKTETQRPQPHRCAIVVKLGDTHSWKLAQFYEGMVALHSPENVIIFGDIGIARTWLGLN